MTQKAFRDDAMSATQIKVWHKCFKDGRESVESDPCSERPATSRTPDLISSSINVSFSYYMDGYFLDRPHTARY